jgi:hypothetical protein
VEVNGGIENFMIVSRSGYWMENWLTGVRAPNPGRGKDFLFCAAPRPAVGQIHLPENGYRGILPYGYNSQVMNLIIHFSLRPNVKHNWSFAFTLHTSSYRGA